MVPLHSLMDPDHGMAGLRFRQIRPRLVGAIQSGANLTFNQNFENKNETSVIW